MTTGASPLHRSPRVPDAGASWQGTWPGALEGRVDQLLKRDRLQSAGVASYWLIDPDEPSVLVLELRDGSYVEVARVQGDEACELTAPFAVRIVPTALLD